MNAKIDLKHMLRGQMVLPLDCDWLAPRSLDGRAGIMPLIPPQHQSFRDRQRIQISLQRARLEIDRRGSRIFCCIDSLSAPRKDKSRYRCKA